MQKLLIIVEKLKRELSTFLFKLNKNKITTFQKKILSQIDKKNVKVVFFVNSKAKWQYEGVYRLMEEDPIFDPWVAVVPNTSWGKKNEIDGVLQTIKDFDGYNLIKTFNQENNQYLDINKTIDADIIFFNEPSGGHWLYKPFYFYKKSLCCYIPYCYNIDDSYPVGLKKPFYEALWLAFTETEINRKIAIENSNRGEDKFIHTGYPPMDHFIDIPKKTNKRRKKLLIWAPHHTIDATNNSSPFLEYHQTMLEIASNYKSEIDIVFKPHPLLKYRLYETPGWGQQKTDEYFSAWENGDNTSLATGNYTELFIESDAMIHDGFSFAVEYLFVNKPICYTLRNNNFFEKLNELGQQALDLSYYAKNKDDILYFVREILLDNNDVYFAEREDFLSNVLLPPNDVSAAKNVLASIKNKIYPQGAPL